jgi:hypothetical protein
MPRPRGIADTTKNFHDAMLTLFAGASPDRDPTA